MSKKKRRRRRKQLRVSRLQGRKPAERHIQRAFRCSGVCQRPVTAGPWLEGVCLSTRRWVLLQEGFPEGRTACLRAFCLRHCVYLISVPMKNTSVSQRLSCSVTKCLRRATSGRREGFIWLQSEVSVRSTLAAAGHTEVSVHAGGRSREVGEWGGGGRGWRCSWSHCI